MRVQSKDVRTSKIQIHIGFHPSSKNTYIVFITNRFHKHALRSQPRLFQNSQDMLSPLFCGIGGIKGGHAHAILAHILEQIGQGGVAGHGTRRRTLHVVGVVKLRRLHGPTQLAAIVADIEYLRGNVVKEGQKAANALGNVCFAWWKGTNESRE
jgi:hypothetical protein